MYMLSCESIAIAIGSVKLLETRTDGALPTGAGNLRSWWAAPHRQERPAATGGHKPIESRRLPSTEIARRTPSHRLPRLLAAELPSAALTIPPLRSRSPMEREVLEFDVQFVGAGPAGLAGAIHLADLV